MDHAFSAPAPDPPGVVLRQWLCAANDGEIAAYRSLLRWAAERARMRGASEAEVQRVLIIIDRLRHTYDPWRCPLRWIDAILDGARLRGA